MKTILAAVILAAWPQPYTVACDKYDVLVGGLSSKYGESRSGVGVTASGGAIVELFTNDETGTWTLVRSGVNGVACVISAGKDGWEYRPELKGDPA